MKNYIPTQPDLKIRVKLKNQSKSKESQCNEITLGKYIHKTKKKAVPSKSRIPKRRNLTYDRTASLPSPHQVM